MTSTPSIPTAAPNSITASNTVSDMGDDLSSDITTAIYTKLAQQLEVTPNQVRAFVTLFDEGATVPFIARYRKEATGGLDDAQLRALEKGLVYERGMAKRRLKIIQLLTVQDKLTDELLTRINNATSKLELEDIYLPYRPRRRSMAAKARLVGLEVIAQTLKNNPIAPIEALNDYQFPKTITDESGQEVEIDLNSADFKDFDFTQTDKQLAGVESIIIDEWTQDLDLLDSLREGFAKTATITSSLVSEDKREAGEKFSDYFEHSESLARLPNHRLLAMLRGRQENVLVLKVEGEDTPFIDKILKHFNLEDKEPAERREFLVQAAHSLWRDKWRPHIEHRLLTQKRLTAEADAIDVFANNLQHLLMAAPAGPKVILGVDPGIRHGVKMAVIDANGHVVYEATQDNDDDDKPLDTNQQSGNPVVATVYPFAPDNKRDEAKDTIANLLKTYNVDLVAIGNGTASRETDTLIKEVINENDDIHATAVMVNEAGASVYSASELASQELGALDVSIRGAVSIARRLQDPLSELVKVEPKAIGVGQYQHDVNQSQLNDSLDKVIQDSVNAVGVDVNTASPAILTYIAGLNRNVAQQIVNYRREHGAFNTREALKNVPRLGVKTFEQAAGFLRIRGGDEPLDATGVHPESYSVVKEILAKAGKTLDDVLGNDSAVNTLPAPSDDIADSLTDDVADDGTNKGVDKGDGKAINDVAYNIGFASIKQELAKPAHDPRPKFKTAKFREDVNTLADLEEGMQLEGVVTNVTTFGCFVDVGVHQDGLVHISQMANEFVDDPINHVKPGQIVSVRVISVDEERGRIGFSMKSEQSAKTSTENKSQEKSVKAASTANTNADNSDSDNNSNVSDARTKRSNLKSSRQTTQDRAHRDSNRKPQRDTSKSNNSNRKNSNRSKTRDAKSEPQKIGTLGALLKEAGLK